MGNVKTTNTARSGGTRRNTSGFAARTTDLTLAANAEVQVPFTSGETSSSTDAYWNPALPNRVYVRRPGVYNAYAAFPLVTSAEASQVHAFIRFNGGGAISVHRFSNPAISTVIALTLNSAFRFNEGDYVDLTVLSTAAAYVSGGYIINPVLQLTRTSGLSE